MFGHRTQAEAVVITREKLHESAVEHGSNYHHWHYETWRFVLEVRQPTAQTHRIFPQAIPGQAKAGLAFKLGGDRVFVPGG
jgi:hypothetical protein